MSEVYNNHNTTARVFCRWSLRPVMAGHTEQCPDECPDSAILGVASARHAADLGRALLEQMERGPAAPAIEAATAWRGVVVGPGDTVGGVRVPVDQRGLYLGNPEIGTILVLGELSELQAWVENLRWQLLDVPMTAACVHCGLEITKTRPGDPWRDGGGLVECGKRRSALAHEPMERQAP